MSWMTCNTCRTVVKNNETGICHSCQGGFTGVMGKDAYLFTEPSDYYPEVEELKEKINATKERIKQIDDKLEHQNRDEGGEASEASRCDRPINCS